MNLRTFRLFLILGLWLLTLTACSEDQGSPTPTLAPPADPNTLTVAASPEMSPLLGKLAEQFNATLKGKTGIVPVKIAAFSPSEGSLSRRRRSAMRSHPAAQ